MSDESPPPNRLLRPEEVELLRALLAAAAESVQRTLRTAVVQDMRDGSMGGIRFVQPSPSRSIGKAVAEAEYVDADGVLVSIVVNADDHGNLYEVDFWKVDFSPLIRYPTPDRLRIKRGAAP